jgi:hypothetical protein
VRAGVDKSRRQCELHANAPIVGAGIGAGLLREVSRRLSRDYVDFATLIDVSPNLRSTVSSVAPAVSVAILGWLPRICPIRRGMREPEDRSLVPQAAVTVKPGVG